ncbi:MAG: SDR family NAD(P)-dependent oxidoreductase [Candidatus Lokiarchaeota archaeon]|nr:SDR family NAD(P)-dependent oxidoreductase [Candidatus Lokiarchaeota archaeon]
MQWSFEGKGAIITGGGSGIGRQIALDMANSGANVAILDIVEENGNKVLEELKNIGKGKALFHKLSVSDKEAVDTAVAKTFEVFGDVDFLVNCAGVLRDFLISKFNEKYWDFTVDVNLKGVAVCMQALSTQWVNLSKAKAKEKGVKYLETTDNPPRVIVNISSMAADGNMGQLAYSATKAGVVGMTLTAAKELNRYNVRSHAVKPTLIDTPIIGDLLSKDEGKFKNMYENRIPFGIGKTSYVSDVVCFLCSEGGYFLNGCIIPINGGKVGGL